MFIVHHSDKWIVFPLRRHMMIILFHSTEEWDYYHHLELKFKWRKKPFLLNYLDRSHRKSLMRNASLAILPISTCERIAKKQKTGIGCVLFALWCGFNAYGRI